MLVTPPRRLESGVATSAVPHLHVGEQHHLVHHLVLLDEPVNDLVAVGAVTYGTLKFLQLAGSHQDVVGRHVDHAPVSAEDTGDDLLATALEQHREQQTDIEHAHGALGTDLLPHRAADIRSEEHAGVLVEALDIGGAMLYSHLQSRHQSRGAGAVDVLHLTVGREVTERQLFRLSHLSSVGEAVADKLQVSERHVGLKHIAEVAHQGHVAKFATADQFLPFLAESHGLLLLRTKHLLAEGRQLSLPSIGNGQLTVHNLVEQSLLLLVLGLGVDEKESVA